MLHSKLGGTGGGCVFPSNYIYIYICLCVCVHFLIRRANLSWVCPHGASHVLFFYCKGF